MMGTRTAKAMVAIAWKAGFSMDMAIRLQRDFAKLDDKDMVRAKPDGGFPLSEADLDWFVESFLP